MSPQLLAHMCMLHDHCMHQCINGFGEVSAIRSNTIQYCYHVRIELKDCIDFETFAAVANRTFAYPRFLCVCGCVSCSPPSEFPSNMWFFLRNNFIRLSSSSFAWTTDNYGLEFSNIQKVDERKWSWPKGLCNIAHFEFDTTIFS